MPNALIVCGDARKLPFADESVNCCVTSPPYYGLRDYGTATWVGGSESCDHKGKPMPTRKGFNERYFGRASTEGNKQDELTEPIGPTCPKCGAIRIDSQIGLEQSPEEYVAQMVAVFREVKRVLRHDGVLWLNLGDSYATGTKAGRQQSANAGVGANRPEAQNSVPRIGTPTGLKTKDLIGIPWMVAFALRSDGWFLRQDIIWAKGNPMPEPVSDRCTKAHEYLFLLSKSKNYYFDNEAINEDAAGVSGGSCFGKQGVNADGTGAQQRKYGRPVYVKRNKRSVWNVNPKPYKGAHFATFPPKLIEPCILAGCPVGGVVLDPFMGSGTTAEVALQHGRNAVGTELNQSYIKLCHERLAKMKPVVKTTEMGTLFEL